jgi:hypothetical protein
VIEDALLQDPARKARLIDPVPASELIAWLSESAAHATPSARIQLMLVQAAHQPECFRVEAKIPVPDELFDCLFNGRSGYRANYYASAAQGAAFNRRIVDTLTPAVLDACQTKIFRNEQDAIRRSLSGQYSKIWVVGDGCAFLGAPAALRPARWADYWQRIDSALGLRLPCPPPPQLDLKGTFIRFETDEEWVDWVAEEKKDRDEDLSTRVGSDLAR